METMQENSKILGTFKKSLIDFLDELIETFPGDSDFITLRILVKDQIPTQVIMDSFIEDLAHVKQLVSSRNDDFFVNSNPIFSKLGREDNFRTVWTSPGMTKDNKDATWRWFDQFVLFAEKYLDNLSKY